MITYVRWFPQQLVIDGIAIAPAFVLAELEQRRRDEKGRQQVELQAWEDEGGSPAPRAAGYQHASDESGPSTLSPVGSRR